MDKAYQLKDLAQYVKDEAAKEGLVLAEQAVEKLGKAIYQGSKRWAKDSAVISETKLDDFVSPYYDTLDTVVYEGIEKGIDLDGDGK